MHTLVEVAKGCWETETFGCRERCFDYFKNIGVSFFNKHTHSLQSLKSIVEIL